MLFLTLYCIILINFIVKSSSQWPMIETRLFYVFRFGEETMRTRVWSQVPNKSIHELLIDYTFLHFIDKITLTGELSDVEISAISSQMSVKKCLKNSNLRYTCGAMALMILMAGNMKLSSYVSYGYDTYLDGYYACAESLPQEIKTKTLSTIPECEWSCKNFTWIGISNQDSCACIENLIEVKIIDFSSCYDHCPERPYSVCGGRMFYSIYSRTLFQRHEMATAVTLECYFDIEQCMACPEGRSGTRCNDIDCSVNNGGCGVDNCESIAWYGYTKGTCKCRTGYYLRNDLTCNDIDECELFRPCIDKNSYCNNTEGSYACNCFEGYSNSGYDVCLDIDECMISNPCKQLNEICKNTFGSYVCKCDVGFETNSAGDCVDIDECAQPINPCKIYKGPCVNTMGSFWCTCGTGFRNTQNNTCVDIDECLNSTTCNLNVSLCQNTIGHYNCICKAGYSRENPKNLDSPCIDNDECSFYVCGRAECSNIPGSYTCYCEEGQTLRFYDHTVECEDNNECFDFMACDDESSACINLPNSFMCLCLPGYINIDNFTCSRDANAANITDTEDLDITTVFQELAAGGPGLLTGLFIFVLLSAFISGLFVLGIKKMVARMRLSIMSMTTDSVVEPSVDV